MHLRQMKDCANGTGVVMYRVNISNGYYRVLSVQVYIVDKGCHIYPSQTYLYI